ncbi:MAG: hypothetical protein KC931_25490 [Candidatus Omnitrophica bacterium]|nr:hypothetical protein [Candidatus Omnitrophota bacterium]
MTIPLLLLAGLAVVCLWGWIESYRIREVETEFRSPQVPKEFEGYRIVLIGGLHLGNNNRWVQQLRSRLLTTRGEVLLVAGNVKPSHRANNSTIHNRLQRLLEGLPFPDGIVCVRGYRDRKGFWDEPPESPGYTLLSNNHLRIERGASGLSLLGLQTAHASHLDRGLNQLREALETLGPTAQADLKILLGQSPDLLRVAQGLPVDLILAVDNLFYQVRIPGWGVPRRDSKVPWSWGFGWKAEGRIRMYLSPGLGTRWSPFRFFCRPEIVTVVLGSVAAERHGAD